jgi:hypothetical protein
LPVRIICIDHYVSFPCYLSILKNIRYRYVSNATWEAPFSNILISLPPKNWNNNM